MFILTFESHISTGIKTQSNHFIQENALTVTVTIPTQI